MKEELEYYPLFDEPINSPPLESKFDSERLRGQMAKVFSCMQGGVWRTISELKTEIGGGSETGISAALRSLRKLKYGGFEVDRRRRGDPNLGLWEYRLNTN